MDKRAIGVFDSGLGGLTAVKEIMERLPNENLIYFGDTGRVPYGTRSEETIIRYSRQDIRFLQSFDVKMIVVACGTVSSVALPIIKGEFGVPIVGVVEATADAAVKATRNNKIGIIGTQGTISSGAYSRRIHSEKSNIRTYSRACPLFVPLVENGHFDTQVTRLVIEEYLADIKKQGIDTLILGCTHYPLLEKAIADFKIKNSQMFSDHDDCIEITTAGKFYFKNGKYYLLYKEYADIGEVSVMIKVDGDRVSIRRSGASSVTMNYAENYAEEVLYRLPYGDIVLELRTSMVDNMLTEDGGKLAIEYDLVVNNEAYGNKILIEAERND